MRPDPIDSRKSRKQLGKTLFSAEVFPFVDKARLVRSPLFEEMVQEAAEQAIKHRNTTVAKNLLIPFAGTRYFKPILRYLVDKGAVTYEVADARLSIRPSTTPTKSGIRLAGYLKQYEGTVEDAFGRGVKIDGEKKPYLDAMDSGARLPGSFEGGKRR